MSQHSYQSPEQRKDEFRRYLEKSGAIESLTTVLVNLYEETDKPLESTEYIRRSLNDSFGGSAASAGGGVARVVVENEKLRKENSEMKKKMHDLTRTIETLRVNLKHARDEAKGARDEVRKMKNKGGSS